MTGFKEIDPDTLYLDSLIGDLTRRGVPPRISATMGNALVLSPDTDAFKAAWKYLHELPGQVSPFESEQGEALAGAIEILDRHNLGLDGGTLRRHSPSEAVTQRLMVERTGKDPHGNPQELPENIVPWADNPNHRETSLSNDAEQRPGRMYRLTSDVQREREELDLARAATTKRRTKKSQTATADLAHRQPVALAVSNEADPNGEVYLLCSDGQFRSRAGLQPSPIDLSNAHVSPAARAHLDQLAAECEKVQNFVDSGLARRFALECEMRDLLAGQ